MNEPIRISVAIPLHNEQSVLHELISRVGSVLQTVPGGPHEMLFVDDGSSDQTLQILEQCSVKDSRVSVIVLSRNFGHQAALTAALDNVIGDVVVILDGDLQDPPESIPRLLEKYHQGYDVVYAQRRNRKEAPWLKICFFVFYRLMASLSDMNLPLDAGDFGLLSRRVVNHLRQMPEHHRYLRGMRSWVGFRQIGIPIERSERFAGESKYGVLRYLKLASDAIFSFSTVPIRAAALLGFVAVSAAVLFAIYSVFSKFVLHQNPKGFTALLFVVTFLSGTILLFLGIIGEYVGRIYEEVKARPIYVIKQKFGKFQENVPGSNQQ
jgi:glycosyltransferase involved in cell wall biosynthesis